MTTTTSKYLTADRLTTIRRTLTTILTGVAFANSYSHTTQWFVDHGQADQANVLAALPEVSIFLVALTLALGKMNTVTTWIIRVIGFLSVAITITANLAGAAVGIGGVVAALVAPVFAILGIALEFSSLVKAAPVRKPRTATAKAAPAAKAPAKKRNRGVIDTGILWATQQATWPTQTEIMEQFPTINRNTASRIHNAKPVEFTA
jgi:hypothetical protein